VCSLAILKSDDTNLLEISARHPRRPGELLGMLLDLQSHYNYLPKEALKEVAAYLEIPLSQVYSVATFYKSLSLKPRGEHVIRVCLGTACHLRGAPAVLEGLQSILGIAPGETTADLKFTLDGKLFRGLCFGAGDSHR
jgi:NADH:ubiquinone oxidoreductase subunit E